MKDYQRLTVKNVGRYTQIKDDYSTFDCLRRLAELEDKLENGTLIDLPCKIGDTVWLANPDGRLVYGKVSAIDYEWKTDASNNGVSRHARFMALCPEEFYVKRGDDAIYGFFFEYDKIGERVFLTEDEARKKLGESKK